MSSVIFAGDRLKALKNALKLSDKATIFSDSVDPTVTPFNAQMGDVLISTTTGKLYIKADNGLSTNWDTAATTDNIDTRATIELDNLGTTAVNADIIPASDSSVILGSSSNNWFEVHAKNLNSNAGLNLNSTDADISINADNDLYLDADSIYTTVSNGFNLDTSGGSSFDLTDSQATLVAPTMVFFSSANDVSFQDSRIKDVANPTGAQDVATKFYVDQEIDTIQAITGTFVVGPGSATDNAIVRYDNTTGKLVQNSLVTISDAGTGTGFTQLNVDNIRLDGNTINATNAAGNLSIDPGAGTAQINFNSATQIFYSSGAGWIGGGWAGNFNSNPAGTGNVTISPGNNLFFGTTAVSGIPTTIIGISAPSSALASKAQFYYLKNQLGVDITITNEDSGATAANRIVTGTGASYLWKDATVIVVIYDTGSSRWRMVNGFINPIASSTDNALVRWDSTTGQLIQNSGITVDDSNVISGVTQLNVDNLRLDGNTLSSTDTNGNVIVATDGTGNVNLDTTRFNRSKDGTNFVEEEYVDSVTLTGSTVTTAFSYAAASYTGAIVHYTVTSNAGEVRTGIIMISNKADGSTVNRTDTYNETADVEVTSAVDFSTPNIRLQMTNANASSANMRLDVKLIRA